MGYYINGGMAKGKCEYLESALAAVPFDWKTKTWDDVPQDKVPVIVVDNGPFEAAGIAYSENEYLVFTEPSDKRPRTGYLIDREKAIQACPAVGREWK